MLNKILLLSLFAFLLTFSTIAQSDQYPKDYFRSPLNVPLYLAGNFGEIRSNHFHAGIDIKTQQREGLDVFAAADGYISRINVSLYGYGKALYITHPNGYTTVYAHLQKFSPEIEEYVRKSQYDKKKFTITLYPSKEELKVTKGQVVAKSGNTGGSGGPHLHFEIRDSKNEVPLNPLLFGFKIKDDIKPILKNVALYPLNDTSYVNGKNKPANYKLYGSAGKYSLAKDVSLKAKGVIGVGIEAIDRLNGSNNRCGVYSIALRADSQLVYKHEMEQIPFHLSRYINSHVDFKLTKKHRKRIQKSFLDANNQLNIYKDVASGGRLYFSKYGHELDYEVIDSYGNKSHLSFKVDVDTNDYETTVDSTIQYLKYTEETYLEDDSLKVSIASNSTYKDLPLEWKKLKRHPKAYAPSYEIMDIYTPLHKKMSVSLKIDSVPENYVQKLYAVSLSPKGKVISPEGGKIQGDWMTFKTRSFGAYTVLIDTIPPTVRPHNFKGNGKTFSTLKYISFTIKDNQSGIASYNGYVDDSWVLMEYDTKKKRLWYEFDSERLERGKHSLKVVITDKVGNSKTLAIDFIW